jgi:hypothetical protein
MGGVEEEAADESVSASSSAATAAFLDAFLLAFSAPAPAAATSFSFFPMMLLVLARSLDCLLWRGWGFRRCADVCVCVWPIEACVHLKKSSRSPAPSL